MNKFRISVSLKVLNVRTSTSDFCGGLYSENYKFYHFNGKALDIGETVTGGCTGFAEKMMIWPEEMIIGGTRKNKSGYIKRCVYFHDKTLQRTTTTDPVFLLHHCECFYCLYIYKLQSLNVIFSDSFVYLLNK